MCRVELLKCLPIHRYSVDIFSYSGPSGIFGSDGKQSSDRNCGHGDHRGNHYGFGRDSDRANVTVNHLIFVTSKFDDFKRQTYWRIIILAVSQKVIF